MQAIERRRGAETRYDPMRTARLCAFRLAVFGPAFSLWLRVLERNVTRVPVKVALDQLVWTPPSISVFYTWMAVAEGHTLGEATARARRMLWPTLQVNWPFWCGVQLFTFSLVPPVWRMAWISCVHVGWNAFLSSLNQRARLVGEGGGVPGGSGDGAPAPSSHV